MRILILDTELWLPIFEHMLSHCDVEFTSDTEEALRWYNERAPYDIVLAGLFAANGLPLIAHICRINPTQAVAVMTGCAGDEPLARVHELNIPVLRKPFSAEELMEFIHQLR